MDQPRELEATQQRIQHAVRGLPVDEHGNLVGVVAFDDRLLLLSRELQSMATGIRTQTLAV